MLEVLVRDWPWPDEHEYGGKGGDELLKQIFQVNILLFVISRIKIIKNNENGVFSYVKFTNQQLFQIYFKNVEQHA